MCANHTAPLFTPRAPPPSPCSYYDSITARRTFCGNICQLPCCFPPIYKVTSERVLFTQWDMYRPCDDPCTCCFYWPWWCFRGCAVRRPACLPNPSRPRTPSRSPLS